MRFYKFILLLIYIKSTVNSIEINCNYSIERSTKFGDKYICFAKLTKLNYNQSVEAVSGEHLDGKSNDDVDGVAFVSNLILNFIPQGLEKFFPELNVLGIIVHNITELKGNEFKNYTKLRNFMIQRGPLERISGNLFEFTPLLSSAGFMFNRIKFMSQNFLSSLKKLSTINFTENECIKDYNEANTPEEIEKLVIELQEKCLEVDEIKTEKPVTLEDLNEEIKKMKEILLKIAERFGIL